MKKLTTYLCNLEGKRIVLASKSPRRLELLTAVGMEFSVMPSEVEETPDTYSSPLEYVTCTAKSKLNWVWQHVDADLLIAADTVVVKDGKIYEKPLDWADASRMLKILSGDTHQVITVICLRSKSDEVIDHEQTTVSFNPLSAEEIEAYLQTGEPFDKAGAYGIQGNGAIFIKKIEGCYFNVMGFPLARFYNCLRGMKI